MAGAADDPLLRIAGIGKHFSGSWVLRDVGFTVAAGQIVMLVGENGAGKSTLKNIIAGLLAPDAGTIAVAGETFQRLTPGDADRLGIGVIHQELSLFGNLSAAENIFITHLPRRAGVIDRRQMHRRAETLLDKELGAVIDVRREVASLSLGERQLVEIAKAIGRSSSLLVLDEPTTCLSLPERRRLFDVIRRLQARGYGVIYITHFMEEVYELADWIVVLRDGEAVGSGTPSAIPIAELPRLMVGRDVAQSIGDPPALDAAAPILLEVDDLDDGDMVHDVSFAVRAGEILGLGGLLGSGRSEIAEAIVGLRATAGSVRLDGAAFAVRSPRSAQRRGLVLVSEDRRRDQVFLVRPLRENVTIAALERVAESRWGLISPTGEADMASSICTRHRVAHPGLGEPMAALSGGNQQKAIIGRWLEVEPRVCILDEPTKGVDIGARSAIHRLVFALAARGVAVLLISSDIPELLALSHRILVLHKGRAVTSLARSAATAARILTAASTGRAAP